MMLEPAQWKLLLDGAVLVFCLGCIYTDVREFKLYNAWTFPFMGLGLVLALVSGGQAAFLSSILGVGLAFAVLYPLFAMGGFAAGDVKMLMAIGALKGWRFMVSTTLYGAVAGAVLSFLVFAYDCRRLGGVMSYLILLKTEVKERKTYQESIRTTMAYGVALAIGGLLTLWHPLELRGF